ncbi:MAG: hypothetical protein M1826_004254 [Phylliscum demangeonii]|nr:MAG: hypothetical protein M1826_004254 [Phylliscum demangeonii]
MDTGGLAHMTYPNLPPTGTLGVPGSGYASKGKGSHLKHLSMPPPSVGPPLGSGTDGAGDALPSTGPRTSRSHLLAGLRTAPRTGTHPPSAPAMQLHHLGLSASQHAVPDYSGPRTAVGSGFGRPMAAGPPLSSAGPARPMFAMPEQVLAPPALNFDVGPGENQIDPQLYAELLTTNLYLAQQQQRLQQQLINVTAVAQLQGLGLHEPLAYGMEPARHGFGAMAPRDFSYPPRDGPTLMQAALSPMNGPHARPSPLYNIVNQPLPPPPSARTDGHYPAIQHASSRSTGDMRYPSPVPSGPPFRAQASPPPLPQAFANAMSRKSSPPRALASAGLSSPSLPPPSANAFRRGHQKVASLASTTLGPGSSMGRDLTSPLAPKSAGFPPTPLTGTFGPGQGRAGEHPVRQPRGPPPLEELMAHPTSTDEGSKNFVARQRRRAVHSLVRAGLERRGGRAPTATGSAGSLTPVSELDVTFSVSDHDSDSGGGGGLGCVHAAAGIGAVGSERERRPDHRHRAPDSVDGRYTAASLSSDDGTSIGGPLVEVRADRGATDREASQ